MKKVLITGYGVVGHNMLEMLKGGDEEIEFYIKDPLYHTGFYKKFNGEEMDFEFICVPTPMREDGSADTSIVEQVLRESTARTIVIKSTVPVGTCRRLLRETGVKFIFSPEWFGGTIHSKIPQKFIVISDHMFGRSLGSQRLTELFKPIVTPEWRYHFVEYEEAEMSKYMENSFLALKVTFVNEMFRICEHFGLNYDIVREIFISDSRISPYHTYVNREHPYYKSVCFDKDIPALIHSADGRAKLLESMVEINRGYMMDSHKPLGVGSKKILDKYGVKLE